METETKDIVSELNEETEIKNIATEQQFNEFIMKFIPSIESIKSGKLVLGDYKTVLQEIIQQNPEEKIAYEIAAESGQAHNKQFTANVLLNGQVIGTGIGKSKKEAEQNAAREAIGLMGYETN